MRRLRLGFASDALVERPIDASGLRAIEAHHLHQALASQAVQDALAGWGRLSQDEAACRLDRVLVYHAVQAGQTSLVALIQLLREHGIEADAQALRESLARLQLAYILRRQDARYRFAIPLPQSQFESSEVEQLPRQELSAICH